MQSSHRLAAILFTDIVGYTVIMQDDEEQARLIIRRYNAVLEKTVAAHHGEVVNYYGDGSLCIFSSATESVRCAMEVQKELQSDPVVPLRIGLHIGEVFFEDGKALGDGVNVASRIQSLGQANTILLSKEIFDKIRNHPETKGVSLGSFDFKNVNEPMEVFALANDGLLVPKRERMEGKLKEGKKNSKIAIAAVVLILLAVTPFVYTRYFRKGDSKLEKSIAVLPFANMSNDPAQEYFAEGMMDEILNQLYKIGGWNVISRTSSMAYKDTRKTSKEIASELGVANLLEGSVQKEGERIRIIVQLIDGKNDKHLWAETYDREFKEVFAIQSDIAQQIAASLKVKIDPKTKSRIEYIPTENTSAYNLYLQARERALDNGWKELLEKVVQLDSSFAPAYADLGFYWLIRGIFNGDLDAKQVLDSALPLLKRSIKLDSNLASAHNYMAQAHLWFEWDFKSTEAEWKKFFQLNPSGIIWANNYVNFLQSSGRFQDALIFSRQNRDNDKNNFGNWQTLASCYIYVNQPDKGLLILDSASLLLKNLDRSVFWVKAFLFIYLGKYQQSIDNLNKYFEVAPDARNVPRMQAELSISYFHTGLVNEAEKIVDSLKMRSKQSPVGSPAFFTAMVYASTDSKELALQWLEKAYTDHEVEMFWLKVEPLFKPLHNDPRFQNLLHQIGFPE